MAASTRRLCRAAGQLAGRARQVATAAPDGPPGAGGELPSLKAALRAIYKRVHPDLFQDFQPAKDANTRSFKMLHEYLDAARTGSKVPLPYRFHFYVRTSSEDGGVRGLPDSATTSSSSTGGNGAVPEPATAETAATGAAAATAGVAPPGLREVTVTLPPPTRGAPGDAMSGSARKAFGSLLAALGLPSRFAGEGEDAGAAADEFSRFVSLREFLPQAVETVHQHAAAQSSAQHQLGALRTALRLGRHVTAGFGEPAASAGALQQLALLQRLVAVLDFLPPTVDLSDLRVTIGQANGVDALGTVWLDSQGSQEAWQRHLQSVDAEHCRQRQALRQQVRQQEAAVAAALGLAMVYTQQEASMSPDYRQALERLGAAAAARGRIGAGRFTELPVMLQPAEAAAEHSQREAASSSGSSSGSSSSSGSGSSSEGLGRCKVDAEAGLLRAPTDVTAEELYSAVQRVGRQVLAAAAVRRRREADLAALRTQVERKVMLRRLLRHPTVSDARFKSCLDRMLGSAQKLSGLLHGQAVRVAEVNGLSPDKAVIDIAWNWQL